MSTMIKYIYLFISFCLLPFSLQAQLKYLQDVKTIPSHPRILLLAGEEKKIKDNISADPLWAKMHQAIIDESDKIVDFPVLERIQTEKRLLSISREAIRRVFYLSYGYWEYGTSFNVLFLSAIEKAFGSEYGLSKIPGFLNTAYYEENMTGPQATSFNYSDNALIGGLSTAMFWFSSQLKDASVLWNEKRYLGEQKQFTNDRILPAILIWGSQIRTSDISAPKQLFWTAQGITPVTLMRTSWTDPNAIYVGFKGGIASSNHAHMDVDSFIMDANGVRWASDTGRQDYNSLESKGVDLWNRAQNSQRWEVFRYNNFVHNTLTIDNQLHDVDGYANMLSSSSTSNFMNSISDLSAVFKGQLAKSVRRVAVIDKQYVVVRDEIKNIR